MLADTLIAFLLVAALAGGVLARALLLRVRALERQRARLGRQIDEQREQSAEARATLAALLDATADAVLLLDASGYCRSANDAARDWFGPCVNAPLVGLSQSAELDELLAAARGATPVVGGGQSAAGELALRSFANRTVQARVSRVAAPLSDGQEPGYVVLMHDVTQLRRLEMVRRDFVANVSHELRTPLTSVKAMAETLLDGALDDPDVATHFLRTIIHDTDRLARLAADLIDLSRVELQPALKRDGDLAPLIDDVVARLASQRAKADVAVSTQIERPLMAQFDPDELAQVLINLLDNAIKYTQPGGAVIVSARAAGDRVVVDVADTGIGILQQDIPRLFERFYRTDKARSRESGGTGLGLSIVKHIVERHGGEIWIRSEYNRGSTFGFSLPLEPLGGAETPPLSPQPSPGRAPARSADDPASLAARR